MITKDRNSEKEYVTKHDVKEIVTEAVEELGQMLAKNFDAIDKRFQRIETTLLTVATKEDIRNIFDKTVSNDRFDTLTGRVMVLEEKINT